MQIADKMEKIQTTRITYLVFFGTLAIVLISLLSLFFPALLITVAIGSERQVESFEVGTWVGPFLAINIFILLFGIFYYKKLLPNKISNSFDFILKFEVSKKISMIIFGIIIVGYIIFTVNELSLNEIDVFKDWEFIQKVLDNYPYEIDEVENDELKILYVKNFLLFLSQEVFLNVKIIPFVASIALISMTYFLTVKISHKRFAGLVAMLILIQSQTFLRYDTSATFSNFWTLFYVLSLYLIYKKWSLSPIAFIASILSKPLTIAFLPMTFLIIARSRLLRKTKMRITLSYVIIFVGILALLVMNVESGYGDNLTSFDHTDFWSGFSSWAFQMRIDGVVLVFLLPLTLGLFLRTRMGHVGAEHILILLGGILLSAPLLSAFTEFNIQPYRWIPLIVFFSIGVGTLLSKTSIDRSEK